MSTQTQVREQIPYGKEVSEYLANHRQMLRPRAKHWFPDTPERVARAERLTQKLKALMHDPDWDGPQPFVDMAQILMRSGRITEEQFLSIDEECHRVRFADDPKTLKEVFGIDP